MRILPLAAVAALAVLAACSGSGPGGLPIDGGGLVDDDAPVDGSQPDFWDTSGIPPAQNVMMFKFENRTHGVLSDDQIFWRFDSGSLHELHSIAAQPLYDMPANASGRLYFYLCPSACADPTESLYFDFIEFTIGPAQFNGNTTRVDAFGIKLAMRLHAADGFEATVGEDLATFAEDRAATFQRFRDEAPDEFDGLATSNAPYRILEPSSGGFNNGGAHAGYFQSYVDAIWSGNGITIAKPGPDGRSGLDALPELAAAIFRHVGAAPGSFNPNGTLANNALFADPTSFYRASPADYYAAFWHEHAYDGKAYGFPYDDTGAQSSYVSHADPQYLIIAIGW